MERSSRNMSRGDLESFDEHEQIYVQGSTDQTTVNSTTEQSTEQFPKLGQWMGLTFQTVRVKKRFEHAGNMKIPRGAHFSNKMYLRVPTVLYVSQQKLRSSKYLKEGSKIQTL
jgi:hypothetical protein